MNNFQKWQREGVHHQIIMQDRQSVVSSPSKPEAVAAAALDERLNIFDKEEGVETSAELSSTASCSHSSTLSASLIQASHADRTSLPLGLEKVSLVGRSDEIQQLIQAYNRIREETAAAEVVLIRGESGTGKSVLVEHLERIEKKGREFFVTGKFAQLGQARPYGGFMDATTDLCFAIKQSSESLDRIRGTINEMLSSDEIHLLVSVMPTIEFVAPLTDTRDPLLPNAETFNRFMEIYRKFLQCICRPEHPLVLFLDDLQWVDDVSRQLIDSIARDSKMRNFLLIGTVRQQLSLSGVYDLTSEAALKCSEIALGVLDEKDVNVVVSRATDRPLSETMDLSAIVYRKTGGNAYFVIQYLEMLHRDELLVFDFIKGHWQWNAEHVSARTNVSENVVEFLIRKIESLAPEVQVVLMVAACLGFSFRVDVVECILGSEALLNSSSSFSEEKHLSLPLHVSETQIALSIAVQAGLLDKLTGKRCKFSHDRVQQSAYSMLPDGEEGQRFQITLGNILLDLSRKKNAEDWMLYSAIDMLSNSNNRTSEGFRDIGFSEICLQAARKASKKAAFRSAAKYADLGIKGLNPADEREERYDLWLELANLSAEMHFSRGDFSESEVVVQNILEDSKSVDDCFRAHIVSINTLISTEEWGLAVKCGIGILEDLGVPTPKNPSMSNVIWVLMKTKWTLKGRKPSDLETLKPMENPRMAHALFILGTTAFSSWIVGHEHRCTVLCLKMFLLTLQHGICRDSPYAFAAYGMCMSHLGEYALAYEYGSLAVTMLDRPGMESSVAKVMVVVHNYLYYLKKPIQESLAPLLVGYKVGMKSGDVVQAAYSLRARACMGIFAGVHLKEHERELLSFCDFYREFKQYGTMKMQAPWLQLTQNLLGKSDNALKLTGMAMNEDTMLEELMSIQSAKMDGNPDLAFLFYNIQYAKRALFCIFGEFELADENRTKTERVVGGETATIYLKLYDFVFCCLACLAMARKGKRVRYYMRQAKMYRKELTARAEQGSVNCVPLLALFKAEKRAVQDKSGNISLYEDAIAMLGRCGFRLFKAIACERTGEYLLECNNKEGGVEYLRQAWDEFRDYGAYAKRSQMVEKYKGITDFSNQTDSCGSRSSSRLKACQLRKWQQDV